MRQTTVAQPGRLRRVHEDAPHHRSEAAHNIHDAPRQRVRRRRLDAPDPAGYYRSGTSRRPGIPAAPGVFPVGGGGRRPRTTPLVAKGAVRRGRTGCAGSTPATRRAAWSRSVRPTRPLVDRVPPSRRPSHQQHARSSDAGDEPRLRPRPTPARLAEGVPTALSRVGVVVELHTLAPGDAAEEPRLAVPRRTSQPAPVSRLLAAKPVDLGVPWWIPMSTPTKSVTVRNYLLSSP